MIRDATISENDLYRYRLDRRWADDGPLVTWVMLNPSTADGLSDDRTMRRVISFSQRDGYAGCIVVNLYAWRSPSPADLLAAGERAQGPANHAYIRTAINASDAVVAAWGAWTLTNRHRSPPRPPVESVCAELRVPYLCLGKTKGGAPRHPLYLKADTPFQPF